jgi:regulatory protein
MTNKQDTALIQHSALNYLSYRDHSKKELCDKLIKKFPREKIEEVLLKLETAGFINEKRYVENYIFARRQKGYGPYRINLELEKLGISPEIIAEQLEINDNAWLHDLKRLWQKHFKGHLPKDLKTKSKQMRFLYYRGFSAEQIEKLFD